MKAEIEQLSRAVAIIRLCRAFDAFVRFRAARFFTTLTAAAAVTCNLNLSRQ
jgi:uncharacterized Fe-S cluster-containing radical SAM superfamily protein